MLLQRLFYGRYGFDALGRVLLILGLSLLFIAVMAGRFGWALFVRLAAYLVLALALVRMFSRNLPARQAEARRFQYFGQNLRKRTANFRRNWPRFWNGEWWREKRRYKYLRCPRCAARLRVPRGKGKLIITCPRCKHKIEGKS